ncbi:haloacid dehalogenase type II [Nocardioides mesophilus]|uniref:Haloacid dehalogenase type II n=1 Tax=Nocardioides mesophilus TaxID=433659 RepID=A0A7G9RG63_9ACTN|nr:haloacid dehalogenase type II [Nocardioides mesophilus]QNN54588.1 haloacid dehalogenase type II [Nocardioides mesophilus]
MAATPRLVVLDVNETLSDLGPLRDRFEDVGAPGTLAATWFAGVLRDGFALTAVGQQADFAALGTAGLRTLLDPAVLDRPLGAAVEHVMSGFSSLPVHADVGPGLRALADAGIRLVTLSNGSAAVGRSLLERAGLDHLVEACLSVDDAGIWKPHARAYRYALDHCGVAAAEAMLVAVHPWDVDGAHRAGLRTGWVDRAGGDYPALFSRPDVTGRDLVDLAARLH